MAIRREKIGVQVKRVLRLYAHLDKATGMLYNNRRELSVKRKKVTLIGLFVSDHNTFLIRPHVFKYEDKRNATEWNDWFADYYGTILRDTILPGMANRTGKLWRLYRIIGWVANDRTGLIRSKIHHTRNKTKRAGR